MSNKRSILTIFGLWAALASFWWRSPSLVYNRLGLVFLIPGTTAFVFCFSSNLKWPCIDKSWKINALSTERKCISGQCLPFGLCVLSTYCELVSILSWGGTLCNTITQWAHETHCYWFKQHTCHWYEAESLCCSCSLFWRNLGIRVWIWDVFCDCVVKRIASSFVAKCPPNGKHNCRAIRRI